MRPGPRDNAVSLALQAGGASTRMGTDKALAPFLGRSLLEWVIERVSVSFAHSFIVANDPMRFRHLGLPVVTDALPERGSLIGLYSALLACTTEKLLVLACDMPLVTPRLLKALIDEGRGHEIFVPRHGPFRQPLCALYSRSALVTIEEMLAGGERRIDLLFDRVPSCGYLDVGSGRFGDPEVLFLNVNTPDQLQKAVRLAAEGDGRGPLDLAAPGSAGLSPEVERFLADAPYPVVAFVGKKKSGKTTVLLGVIRELVRRGLRLAVIKHDAHSFDVDVPGTDSYRIREAGAAVTGISSPDKYVWIVDTVEEPPLGEILWMLPEPVDLVITEGFKRQPAPKVEVSRRERSTELICAPRELVGVVSDQNFVGYDVPLLAMDDFAGIADLVLERTLP